MPAATHPEFNDKTEALEVAAAFPEQIRGKTILITGVNQKGVGYATAAAFTSQSPATLILAGRNPSTVQTSVNALKADFPAVKTEYRIVKLDLSSQKAVRETVQELEDVPHIDILVNNAAVMNLPTRQFSPEGIELQFATNHIGHFLFTCLLMPKLHGSRIVNVSSLSPTRSGMRWSDINQDKINTSLPADEQPNYDMQRAFGAVDPESKSYLPLEGYNQSKVGNLLFSIALNKRLHEKFKTLSVCVHPGVIPTELSRYASEETTAALKKMKEQGFYKYKTLGAGAATSLVAAVDPAMGVGEGEGNLGSYLIDCQVSDRADPRACSSVAAERLWALSEELVGEKFAW